MQSFLADQNVTLTFDLAPTGMVVASVEMAVVDHEGVELAARAPVTGFVAASTSVTVSVLSVLNAIPALESVGARTINLYLTGTGAAVAVALLSASYRLVREDRLPVPEASFLTMAGAEMVAADMINVAAWLSSTEQQKVAALMEAHNRIASLRFYYVPDDWQSRVMTTIDYSSLESLDAAQFNQLDSTFRAALRRAQVIEAADMLSQGASQDQAYRDAGVTSIVIGESSRTYSSSRGAAASRPVGARALSVLSRFLAPARVGRA